VAGVLEGIDNKEYMNTVEKECGLGDQNGLSITPRDLIMSMRAIDIVDVTTRKQQQIPLGFLDSNHIF